MEAKNLYTAADCCEREYDCALHGKIIVLSRQKDVSEVKWTDGVYDRLANGQRDHPEAPLLKSCRVWQLKPESDVRMRFISLDELTKSYGTPQMADYQTFYDGEVETNDLEALYTKFNVNHPPGYAGHLLSMFNVLELYHDSGSTCYHCNCDWYDLRKFYQIR